MMTTGRQANIEAYLINWITMDMACNTVINTLAHRALGAMQDLPRLTSSASLSTRR